MGSNSSYGKGQRDGKRGSYNPPSGGGIAQIIGDAIFGGNSYGRANKSRDSYKKGYSKARKDRLR